MGVFKTSRGRFIVATERDGQFTAPMTAEARKLTGCSAVTNRDIDEVASSPNVRKYKTAAAARAAGHGGGREGAGRPKSGAGSPRVLQVRLPDDDRDWLDAEAEREETTVTGVLRRLIARARRG